MTTRLDRLLAEAIPDGTFGGPRPDPPQPPQPPPQPQRTTQEDADRHRAELAAQAATYRVGQPLKKPAPARHLRAVPPAA